MHIPDNYLSPSTCAVMGAAMLPVWTISVKKVKKEITKAKEKVDAYIAYLNERKALKEQIDADCGELGIL